MAVMVIQHKVRDYDAWRPVYDAHQPPVLRPALGFRIDMDLAGDEQLGAIGLTVGT